jgi:hypothetical protein
MPQLWRIYLYKRSLDGASPEQLQREFGLPADEIATRIEATRLCFEKQCLLATLSSFREPTDRFSVAAGRY